MSRLLSFSKVLFPCRSEGSDRKPLLFNFRLYNVFDNGFNSFKVLSGKLENFLFSTPNLQCNGQIKYLRCKGTKYFFD